MILCQSCTARNALSREFCWKCGSRLMIASGGQLFEPQSPVLLDEYVLERMSAVEHSLSQLTKRLDQISENVERLAASNFIDHTMIETLMDSLATSGIELKDIEGKWRRKMDRRIHESEEADQLGERMQRILDLYQGDDRAQFTSWIERACEFLLTDRQRESIELFESAHAHQPTNHELSLLLAEIQFQYLKFDRATATIQYALDQKPDSFEATLLRGLIAQRMGHYRDARPFLERAVGMKPESPAAHAALASLLSESGDAAKAIQHLSRSLELKPDASVHFLLGAVCYEEGRHRHAIDHLKEATRIDPHFGEAFYQLGLLCLEKNWLRKAHSYFKTAQSLNPRESRYRRRARSFSKGTTGPDRLAGLIREELRWVRFSEPKRPK